MSRLLIYRLGSIGDTIVALPAFHLIRQHFPSDSITLLTNFWEHGRAAPVTSVLPHRLYDDVLAYPLGTRSMKKFVELHTSIRSRRFDLVISLTEERGFWNSVRDYGFFRACGIREIRGIPFGRSELTNRLEPGSALYRSETKRLLDRLRWLGTADSSEDRWWDLEFTDDEYRQASAAVSAVTPGTPILAFSIGTKFDTKDWSQPNWVSLMSRLADRYADYSLVAIGAADEQARSQEILDLWRGGTVNLCGRVPPRVSACVLQKASVFVGHDSGPMHLAAAVGTPCVAVFSARSLPGEWFPRGTTHTIFYNTVPCLGCELETCDTFAKKCILSIQPDQVFEAVAAHLARGAAPLVRESRYTEAMKSVADGLRQVTRASAAHLTTEERVEQAFRLGDDDLRAYAASKGITLDAARIEVARRRSVGRRPSAANAAGR